MFGKKSIIEEFVFVACGASIISEVQIGEKSSMDVFNEVILSPIDLNFLSTYSRINLVTILSAF